MGRPRHGASQQAAGRGRGPGGESIHPLSRERRPPHLLRLRHEEVKGKSVQDQRYNRPGRHAADRGHGTEG